MYDRLFGPGKIGSLEIKNRLVMTAMACGLGGKGGIVTKDMTEFYRRRAMGGVGLIISEMVCVDEKHSVMLENQLFATRDEHIEEFRKIAGAVHPFGAKVFAQLIHAGNNASQKLNEMPLVSSSAMASNQQKGATRALEAAEIYKIAEKFGEAARRIRDGGFDGVEIHAAHNYLIHQFLSPVSNNRTDEFGGNLENRARFLKLIMESVRNRCGRDFPVMVRVSAEEYIGKKGYHADTGIKICQALEQWGADAINVSASGTASKLSQSVETMSYLPGWRKHLSMAVKKCVRIPVCGVALVRDPDFAEELLEKGYMDFVGSGRNYLADPDWPMKAREGRKEEINRCISCFTCFDMLGIYGHTGCALSPETDFEARTAPIEKNGNGRRVVILGAGLGGLEAAYIAALRGFCVTVFEKEKNPGGQALLASRVPRKEKMLWPIETFTNRARAAGAEIIFNKAPSPEEIAALSPYAIIDATGGTPLIPGFIEGVKDNPMVCYPLDVITGRLDIHGESVVVVGSGMTGLETAEILCERERNNAVVVMEAADKIAPGTYSSVRNDVTAVLDINNVVFMLGRKLTKIGEDRIFFRDPKTGEEYVYPCDRVVLSLGTRPLAPYGGALEKICGKVLRIGDAEKSGKIMNAVHGGYHAAKSI